MSDPSQVKREDFMENKFTTGLLEHETSSSPENDVHQMVLQYHQHFPIWQPKPVMLMV